MNTAQSRGRLTIGVLLFAGVTALVGCNAPPVTTTTASQRTTTTVPPPMMQTTTTTSTEDQTRSEQPAQADPVRHKRHAARHRPVESVTNDSTSEETITTDSSVTPLAATSTTVKKTETTTR